MPLEIQTKQFKPGQSFTLDFTDNITQYTVGSSEFSLTFGDNDHHVLKAEVKISANKSSSKSLQITASATLNDSSGNVLNASDSSITVVAIAWIGTSASSLVLANRTQINSGSSSSRVALPGSNTTILQAMLSGFALEYSKDHHLRSIKAEVGVQQDGTEGSITATASMSDDSGNTASKAEVDGGMIASSASNSGFQIYSTGNLQKSSRDMEIDSKYSKVQALLVGFKGRFSKDHHVKTVGAKISAGDLNNHKTSVSGHMTLKDDSGHGQDDGESHISGIVIAYNDPS